MGLLVFPLHCILVKILVCMSSLKSGGGGGGGAPGVQHIYMYMYIHVYMCVYNHKYTCIKHVHVYTCTYEYYTCALYMLHT